MRAVGIRELKGKLSQYVRLVEAGESVLITDRGTVVAEMRPAGSTTLAPPAHSALEVLSRAGRATLGTPHDPSVYGARPAIIEGGVSRQLLDDERGAS